MKRGILPVIAVALVIGVWSIFRGDSTANVERQVDVPIAVVSIDAGDGSRDQIDSVRDAFPSVSREEIDGAATAAAMDDTGLSVWSAEPEDMAVSLLDELAQILDLDLVSILSSECTATTCELRIVSSNDSHETWDRLKPLELRLKDPPYSAAEVSIGALLDGGIEVVTVSLKRNPWPFATADEFLETRSEVLRDMQEFAPERFASFDTAVRRRFLREADELLSSRSYDATPVSFRGYFDERVIVENVCSYACPSDVQRVIHFDVPTGLTCAQMDGVEHFIDARDSMGNIEQRVFCIPAPLLDD